MNIERKAMAAAKSTYQCHFDQEAEEMNDMTITGEGGEGAQLAPSTVHVPAAHQSGALMALINRAATDPTFDVAKLESLLAVKERWEAAEAKKAFVSALNAFKAEPMSIRKNKHVDFTSAKGRTHYWHATLDNVCDVIGKSLAEHGLSHRWETEQKDRVIRVTCILTHELGHSERVMLEASPDDSGNKNSIQAVGSTVTYLQRYTILSITGMATMDQDDDGRGARKEPESKPAAADPWTPELEKAASVAAKSGKYSAWWNASPPDFRTAAIKTNKHLDFRTVDKEAPK